MGTRVLFKLSLYLTQLTLCTCFLISSSSFLVQTG